MAFALQMNSWIYQAQYLDGSWQGQLLQKAACPPAKFADLSEEEKSVIWQQRNSFPEIGLISYTSQYGLGCFEGLKAYPQPDGKLRLFRPDRNAQRMANSMTGLRMPAFPVDLFVAKVSELIAATMASGELPQQHENPEHGLHNEPESLYIRPFAFSEPGIGVNRSENPYFIVISTPVDSYFDQNKPARALVSERVRATPHGTGSLKCAGNYIVSMLAKSEAMDAGYMEAIFLDSSANRYLEEGSSCNLFVLLDDGSLATPELGDTILAGITRDSVIQLAHEFGLKVQQRKITIDEVMTSGREIFLSGTAAGILPLQSITYQQQQCQLYRGEDSIGMQFRRRLQAIQFGLESEDYGWMCDV